MTRLRRSAATAALLAEACALAEAESATGLSALLEQYYAHVPDADLAGRDAAAVLGAVRSHLRLAEQRPAGSAAVRVHHPSVPGDGWTVPRTVVEVVSEDMPFLVDSITAELTRQGRAIALVMHPVVPVRRDDTGRLLDVLGPDGPDESWVHVEIAHLPDADEQEAVAAGLREVLADVRAAVEDWTPLSATATRIAADLLQTPPPGVPEDEVAEAAELLRWLAEEHATLLGYASYVLEGQDVAPVAGSELGLLRRHGAGHDGPVGPAPQSLADPNDRDLLVVTKAPFRSTVHRPAYLDSISVRRLDDEGRPAGEHRFLALFAASAYTDSVLRLPVVRRKAEAVLRHSGFPLQSHSGRDLLQILETYPRDELFQARVEDLAAVAQEVLHLRERRQVRLFLRRDVDGNYMSCLVYLPRDRYSSQVRLRMQQVLTEVFGARDIEYTVRHTESVLARVHFVVRMAPGEQIPDTDPAALEQRLADVSRSWDDAFVEALREAVGEDEAQRLRGGVTPFPEAYKADYPPSTGVTDLLRLSELADGGLSLRLYETDGEDDGRELRFKVYSSRPMSLSDVLPVLQDMAVEVVDSRPYRLAGGSAHVYDFGLQAAGELHRATEGLAELFQETFAAVWAGEVESDGLNALVLRGGLTCRQVVVLRAYATYLRQSGWTFSPGYVEQCLGAHPGIARLLLRLFEAQFDPDLDTGREPLCQALTAEVEEALTDVPSLDQDRILRSMLLAVRATTRVNHYQLGADGAAKGWLSLKLLPEQIPSLPRPRPEREIWVYSPRVEGVHLRFGAVARGGMRWSDRREDFRTEVLGLVKAQAVKNAVIVPVGAKGGFVAKQLPDPAVDRDGWAREGVACYRTLVRGMLDLTDNLVDGAVVPPPRVVRRDDDDTYLVVAADKGTATFSDIANEVAAEYGFWLGDAFASGGSVGYDHKAMGITARGAWESVQRHFRELDIDSDVDDVTVVGIGDMSGDVFGNGMLLSRRLKLVAAFDHRHIFLDPDPDPEVSFAERERLFALPRSSWQDYDASLLSKGGGVHPRTAKSVPVTPQVRERLGLPEGCVRLTPSELMSAILRAPVDLLWNGGIGTWVKATSESAADVGDKANDAVRVDAATLRCRVIGEGGNLGLTQLGRIEAASAGVRVNTDAIDNSAGVDCSDHEVNIKVLLDSAVAAGGLTTDERNALLAEMTDEVARLVLRDNLEQNVLLGNARYNARSMLSVHRRYLRQLESDGELDRELEFLPSDATLEARAAAGAGLTSPEFAVLTAYAKNTIKSALLETALPDEPWLSQHLVDYFPAQLPARFPEHVQQHPLRRQIITTSVVNEMVNLAGTSFLFRAQEETGAPADQVVRAYGVATAVFGLLEHWREIEQLTAPVDVDVQVALHLEARRLVDRVVRRQLSAREKLDVVAQVERYGHVVAELLPTVADLVQGAEREALHSDAQQRRDQGVPAALAVRSASLLHAFPLLDVVGLADDAGEPPAEVAALYYAVSASFEGDVHLDRITDLPRVNRWQALARSALRDELYAALAALTADVLRTTSPASPEERLAAWEAGHENAVRPARTRLQEISSGEVFDLAAMSVVVRTVRSVLRG